jgi:hypothetical protein
MLIWIASCDSASPATRGHQHRKSAVCRACEGIPLGVLEDGDHHRLIASRVGRTSDLPGHRLSGARVGWEAIVSAACRGRRRTIVSHRELGAG